MTVKVAINGFGRMKIKYGLLYTSWCISLQSVARQQ